MLFAAVLSKVIIAMFLFDCSAPGFKFPLYRN